jgi:hypothetical protein
VDVPFAIRHMITGVDEDLVLRGACEQAANQEDRSSA